MVKTKLVAELIDDGARVLCELDRRNFPVEAMFWVLLPDQDYWRLVIASPIVKEHGGTEGYGRLDELLRGIELAGVTLEDISLFDPASQQYQSLLSVASTSSRLAAGAAWLVFEDAIVYRWTSAAASGELTCDVSLSELNRVWQDERKRLNFPGLLIALEKQRVTLRFHPRNGPLTEIETVKLNFASALRRAHSDCQIDWRD